jgi:hypothetical protein
MPMAASGLLTAAASAKSDWGTAQKHSAPAIADNVNSFIFFMIASLLRAAAAA